MSEFDPEKIPSFAKLNPAQKAKVARAAAIIVRHERLKLEAANPRSKLKLVKGGKPPEEKFEKLSPESQARVRAVTVNLITRHALETGMTMEQARAKAKERVADLIFEPPTKMFNYKPTPPAEKLPASGHLGAEGLEVWLKSLPKGSVITKVSHKKD